jgi:hypothetical protein
MCSEPDTRTIFQNQNLIGIANGRNALSDNDNNGIAY